MTNPTIKADVRIIPKKFFSKIVIPQNQIIEFCKRWQINEFALFGSVLRDDFGPDSDIDILISFASAADWGLFDQLKMEQELADLLHRKIDLVSKKAVEQNHNWIRRQEILNTAQVIYVSG